MSQLFIINLFIYVYMTITSKAAINTRKKEKCLNVIPLPADTGIKCLKGNGRNGLTVDPDTLKEWELNGHDVGQ